MVAGGQVEAQFVRPFQVGSPLVLGEQPAIDGDDGAEGDLGLTLQGPEGFAGGLSVVEDQRRRAITRQVLGEDLHLVLEGLAQHAALGQHRHHEQAQQYHQTDAGDDHRQLAADRQLIEECQQRLHRPSWVWPSLTISRARP